MAASTLLSEPKHTRGGRTSVFLRYAKRFHMEIELTPLSRPISFTLAESNAHAGTDTKIVLVIIHSVIEMSEIVINLRHTKSQVL